MEMFWYVKSEDGADDTQNIRAFVATSVVKDAPSYRRRAPSLVQDPRPPLTVTVNPEARSNIYRYVRNRGRQGMAEVQRSDAALYELVGNRTYISIFDPAAAERMTARLIALSASFVAFANRGRPAPYGTRKLVTVPSYVLSYEVTGDRVTILRLRHGAREPR